MPSKMAGSWVEQAKVRGRDLRLEPLPRSTESLTSKPEGGVPASKIESNISKVLTRSESPRKHRELFANGSQRSKTKSSAPRSTKVKRVQIDGSGATYPITEIVRELENKEQLVRDKNKKLSRENANLHEEVARLQKELETTAAAHKAKYEALEEAHDTSLQELAEERKKLGTLKLENEKTKACLKMAHEEGKLLAHGMYAKNFESYVYRCALAAVFKSLPTIQEKVTCRQVVQLVIKHYWDKLEPDRRETEVHGGRNTGEKNLSPTCPDDKGTDPVEPQLRPAVSGFDLEGDQKKTINHLGTDTKNDEAIILSSPPSNTQKKHIDIDQIYSVPTSPSSSLKIEPAYWKPKANRPRQHQGSEGSRCQGSEQFTSVAARAKKLKTSSL